MRSAPHTFYTATVVSAALLFLLPVSLASAQPGQAAGEAPTDELDLWVPALGMYSGVLAQQAGADLSSCCLNLFDDPAHRDRIRDMAAKIRLWQYETGDEAPLPAV